MSEALERVIKEQQERIDRLKFSLDIKDRDFINLEQRREKLVTACFQVVDFPSDTNYIYALRDILREQGYCLTCREAICECDYD